MSTTSDNTHSLSEIKKYLEDYYHCRIDDIEELINTATGWCAVTKRDRAWMPVGDFCESYCYFGLHMSDQEWKATDAKFHYHWLCSNCVDALEELDEHLHFMGCDDEIVLQVFMIMCATCYVLRNQ